MLCINLAVNEFPKIKFKKEKKKEFLFQLSPRLQQNLLVSQGNAADNMRCRLELVNVPA